jgi:hypothetical protein
MRVRGFDDGGFSSCVADVAETHESVQTIHVYKLIHIKVFVKLCIAIICLILNWIAEVAYGCNVMV